MNRSIQWMIVVIVIFMLSSKTSADIISNSIEVGNLNIQYITDYPENALDISNFNLEVDIIVVFPISTDTMQLFILTKGIKISTSVPTQFDSNNNFYGYGGSQLSYKDNIASFSFIASINLGGGTLNSGKLYFTPFLEFRGNYDNNVLETTFIFLPSFVSDSEFINSDPKDSDFVNDLFFLFGGIIILMIFLFYLYTIKKKKNNEIS